MTTTKRLARPGFPSLVDVRIPKVYRGEARMGVAKAIDELSELHQELIAEACGKIEVGDDGSDELIQRANAIIVAIKRLRGLLS